MIRNVSRTPFPASTVIVPGITFSTGIHPKIVCLRNSGAASVRQAPPRNKNLRRHRAAPVPLEIEVFNFTLPDGAVLPTSFSFDIKTMTNFYGLAKDREASDALIKQMVDLAAKYKITYNQMYWWGLPNMKRDNFFHHLKRPDDAGILKSFALTYLNQSGKNYKSDRWLTDPADPEVDHVIDCNLKFLALHVPKLKKLGILGKAYIYGFDEGAPSAVTEKICGAIKKACPEIPIMTTMRYGDPSLPSAKLENSRVRDMLHCRLFD